MGDKVEAREGVVRRRVRASDEHLLVKVSVLLNVKVNYSEQLEHILLNTGNYMLYDVNPYLAGNRNIHLV